jgi:hypothetical protein
MDHTVKAEGFIWLIIGAFWIIAQIAGAAAKKKQALPPRSGSDREEGRPPVDPIAELLRKMTGIEEFRAAPPEFTEEPQRNSVSTRENPWNPGEIEALPDIKPLRREPMDQEGVRFTLTESPKIDLRPKMDTFRNSVPSIKLPAMSLSFQPLGKSSGKSPAIGKIINPSDKNSLRRAILGHIIFSPPKALEGQR